MEIFDYPKNIPGSVRHCHQSRCCKQQFHSDAVPQKEYD